MKNLLEYLDYDNFFFLKLIVIRNVSLKSMKLFDEKKATILSYKQQLLQDQSKENLYMFKNNL